MKRNGLLFAALLLLGVLSLCLVACGEQPHEHSLDASGFCSTCELPVSATEGLILGKSSDGTYAEVIGYSGISTKVNIPSTYSNLPVKSICAEVFKNKHNISKVIIPDSVINIGNSAFYYCDSLTSVTIGNSVTSIGEKAFAYCDSLTSVTIGNSVTSIGERAFYDCDSLTSVTIGNSVTSIGYSAFSYCNSSLYTTENNLKYVKANNNPYCILVEATNKNLSSYQINSQTQHIASGVFYSCKRLTQITIPDSVTSIGEAAFYGCDSLTSVTIPDSVTSIGAQAFYNCESLTSVTFSDTSTWYRIYRYGDNAYDNWQNKTGGTEINVTDASNNAWCFRSRYIDYYWYKI